MRKIEREMLQAIEARRNWTKGNTRVLFSAAQVIGAGRVTLHENNIALIMHDGTIRIFPETFRNWPTMTTASRLRALGVNASIRNGRACIDGQPV